MKRLPKILRVMIWSALALAGVVFLAYAVENWRGARAWAEVQAKLEQHDISLNLADLVLPKVPADSNFWATPLLAGIEDPENESARKRIHEMGFFDDDAESLDVYDDAAPSIATRTLTKFDLWAEELGKPGEDGARIVFDTLQSKFGDQFAELIAAAKRPNSQTTIDLSGLDSFDEMIALEVPHYQASMHLGKQLDLQALAALRVGEPEIALDLLRVQFRLGEAMGNDPLLISHLVALVHRTGACRVIWEGLAQNAWSAQQMLEIEDELRRVDMVENLARAAQTELCSQVAGMDFLKRSDPREVAALMGANEGGIGVVNLIPDGWLDQNKVYSTTWMLDRTILPARNRDWVELASEPDLPLNRKHPYRFFANMMLPALNSVSKKSGHIHMMTEFAQTACALERHRLEDGEYPESLPTAVTDFDDQPVRYTTNADGYQLYSVGWNRQDDGGETVLSKSGRGLNLDEGDWVWAYPKM